MNAIQNPSTFLPTLLSENASGRLSETDIRFEPLRSGDRASAEIHWLFRPEEAEGAGAALVRYSAGGHAPLHRHPNFELIYVLDGEMSTSQGNVKKNDMILLPPGSTHSSHCETGCLALVIWNRPVELVHEVSE